ncbi:hypothetical protein U9M48_011719 [Paspalum notatum var. saurae]|uniref:Uncharacterized protein n=1 Tax=Paspalum notatum var. saurae TaxID=547442 RepID=A0AAQ3SWE1_PASNO
MAHHQLTHYGEEDSSGVGTDRTDQGTSEFIVQDQNMDDLEEFFDADDLQMLDSGGDGRDGGYYEHVPSCSIDGMGFGEDDDDDADDLEEMLKHFKADILLEHADGLEHFNKIKEAAKQSVYEESKGCPSHWSVLRMQWEIAQKIGDKEVGFLSPDAIAQTNWSSYLKLRDDHPDLANAKTLKERDDIRKAKCKEAKQKVAAYICNSLSVTSNHHKQDFVDTMLWSSLRSKGATPNSAN